MQLVAVKLQIEQHLCRFCQVFFRTESNHWKIYAVHLQLSSILCSSIPVKLPYIIPYYVVLLGVAIIKRCIVCSPPALIYLQSTWIVHCTLPVMLFILLATGLLLYEMPHKIYTYITKESATGWVAGIWLIWRHAQSSSPSSEPNY